MAMDDLNDLAAQLRSSFASTELVLAKFSQGFRKQVALAIGKSSSEIKPENFGMLLETIGKVQGDFAKLKATMDILLAFFPE
jgi:hypothetical protein